MMNLTKQRAYEAYRARDSAFDGILYMGISSTGIYCRPICPARRAKIDNCTFFESPAAAELAGFRPCLRCHPERASFSDAHKSSHSLAERVASILWTHASTGITIEKIASDLGYSSRHIRRVFEQAYHVTPVYYAETCHLLLAKALLQDSTLSILDVSMAAGFGSPRRMNELFQTRYGMTPTSLRKCSEPSLIAGTISLHLPYRPPYILDRILTFLKNRAISGVENVQKNTYTRTVSLTGRKGKAYTGTIQVTKSPHEHALLVTLTDTLLPVLSQVLSRVCHQFDVSADPATIANTLCVMNKTYANTFIEGIRIPRAFDPFETTVRAILGQQISIKAANTLAARFVQALGTPFASQETQLTHLFPTPEEILSHETDLPSILGPLGIIASRTESILSIARALHDHTLSLDGKKNYDETIHTLLSIKGIGPWTAQYIAMRVLGEPDIFMENDGGIKKAMPHTTAKERLSIAEDWRPFRSYATISLWQ